MTDPTRQAEATGLTDISNDEELDEEEVEAAPHSFVDKLKIQFTKYSKKKSKSEEEDEDGEEEKKPKKKLSPIHIIVILALVYFAADEFLIPKDDIANPDATNATEENMKKAVEARRNARKEAMAKNKAENPDATPAADSPAETTPVEPAVTDTTIPDVSFPDTETSDTTIPDTTITETTPTVTESTTPSVDEPMITENPDITPIETVPSETGVSESKDTIDGGMVTDDSDDSNLTDKILQDLEKQANKSEVKTSSKEYVSPPDYEYKGRGLVYNCVGKHWACVDAPSYKVCENNSSSTKTLGKKLECYPFNVYESSKGCENVQNRMVSSSAKTNFCNE